MCVAVVILTITKDWVKRGKYEHKNIEYVSYGLTIPRSRIINRLKVRFTTHTGHMLVAIYILLVVHTVKEDPHHFIAQR